VAVTADNSQIVPFIVRWVAVNVVSLDGMSGFAANAASMAIFCQ
jgi:hypothetical protein